MRIAIVAAETLAQEGWVRMITRGGYPLAWCAASGTEAVAACARDTPDVVLMDFASPQVKDEQAIRLIMKQNPCPILIATHSIDRDSDIVFNAMGAGAMDAVAVPSLNEASDAVLQKIALLGKLSQYTSNSEKHAVNDAAPANSQNKHLVIIGCSSGGPAALAHLLAPLPKKYRSPIVVLQHMDTHFLDHFAGWLREKINLPVDIAREGDSLEPGRVYIAAFGQHLMMNRKSQLYYTVEPIETFYRPSVDVFFKSVAKYWQHPVTAILLTGMGRDGARGLLELRGIGAYTIAQDEQTSAVYGMPKVAAQLGAAVDILPINKIAEILSDSAMETAKRCKLRCTGGG